MGECSASGVPFLYKDGMESVSIAVLMFLLNFDRRKLIIMIING